jgi:GNAT superfamily N-acetyltransferase
MTDTIRVAGPDDATEVFRLIHELAVYEKLDHEVRATPESIRDAMTYTDPAIHVLLAEDEAAGRAVGFALYFHTFSTFEGAPTLYLEDLFVEPDARGSGIGQQLLVTLARHAREKGCARMEWTALDWNEPALRFYSSLGARRMTDWIAHRLDAAGIERLGGTTLPDS